MKIGIGSRIIIIIAIQISLIAASFGYLTSFESKNSLLGNSINIAGKNRFLTSNVLLQSQYYLSGTVQETDLEAALARLKSNVLLLHDGGSSDGIELDPIPQKYSMNWQEVYNDYLALEGEVHRLTDQDALGATRTPSALQVEGNKLIAASDSLVGSLAEYSKNTSKDLLTMQVGLGALNIAVHVVMLYSILRILRPIKLLTNATAAIQQGNLDVTVQQTGNHELRDLAESFNSMVRSLKKSTELITSEKKKYQELYDSAPDLYRMVDTEGILLDCNESYWKQLGYSSKAQLIGKSVIETTADVSVQAMHDSLNTWKETGLVVDREIWLKRNDETIFPTLLSATALRDKNGKIIASNTCIINVTELYKAKNDLEAANARLKELDTMKTEFICVASHELRTPIQPILNYAELARRGIVDQNRAWEVVTKEAQRLKTLATDILDASKIDGKDLKLVLEDFSLNDIIRDIVRGLEPSLKEQVRFRAELALDEIVIINADKSRMKQVIGNILGNAVKFTNEDYIDIKTGSIMDGQYVEVLISDKGGGIPPEMLPKLFTKFATKGRNKGTEGGTGLGLFVSKGIVEAHGGSITGYNNDSGGATFKIWLPIAVKPVVPQQDIAQTSQN